MRILIELDHNDIVGTEAPEFEALFTVVQGYCKMVKGTQAIAPKVYVEELEKARERDRAKARKQAKIESEQKTEQAEKSADNKTENSTEKTFDRDEIEKQIKKIATEGKDKGASAIIRKCIQSYGVEKLSAVPDDKMAELLQKVQAEV